MSNDRKSLLALGLLFMAGGLLGMAITHRSLGDK